MIIRGHTVPTDTRSSPGWGEVSTQALGNAGGLTQFGLSLQVLQPGAKATALQVLQPGAKATVRHWHPHVDECLVVLAGEATVTEDDGPHRLLPGDAACWAAGVPNGHTVSNRSSQPCTLLVVGCRLGDQQAVYVDDADQAAINVASAINARQAANPAAE